MDLEIGKSILSKYFISPGDLVNHVVLPKRLPDTEETILDGIEGALLELIETVSSSILEQQGLLSTGLTLDNWRQVQCDGFHLNEILSKLGNGQSVCLYVRKQNCTVHFTKLDDQHMRIITFRTSLPNKNVTSACGSLLVKYPETVNVVPLSPFLLSSSFSKELEALFINPCEIAMTTRQKAGVLHVEVREPSHPYVISDFLVGLLCPLNPTPFGKVADLSKIAFQKKLRDQVNWKKCLLPFRRSGLWMSAKVILQLSLQEEMDSQQEAKLLYKIIIIQMLNCLFDLYTNGIDASRDVTSQIMAKLARRTKKLSEMMKTENEELESLKEETIQHSLETIDEIHTTISNQWHSTVFPGDGDDDEGVIQICRTKEEWMEDCIHHLDSLSCHLNSDRTPAELETSGIHNLQMIDSMYPTHTVNLRRLLERHENGLSRNQQDVHLNEESIWIYQTEWFVRHRLTSHFPPDQISKLMMAYFHTVFQLYASVYADPVYYSRMTITFLKFIAVLDEIVVTRHPLMNKYKTGIQSEMFLPSLLISDKWEMEFVESLGRYFDDRNSQASRYFWLKNGSVKKKDFCVRFAQKNEEMLSLKKEILCQMEKDIAAKRKEIEEAEEVCKVLQGTMSSLSCSYKENRYYKRDTRRHLDNCRLCSLRGDLEERRKSVTRYQRPLPSEDYLRDAVVFELIIPQDIAALRDGVILFLEEILGWEDSFSPKVTKEQIIVPWMEFSDLQGFEHFGHQSVCQLGSRSRDTLSTYLTAENPDVLLSPEFQFILENGLSCYYYRTPPEVSTPQHPFTLKIDRSNTARYTSLQFALNRDRPTENSVLARQYQCHRNLCLKEFQAFGALRCAHRVQLRNLYAELAGKVLSLDKEPVLQLIMQALWERGPGKREVHSDFELRANEQFALAFLELLKTCGEENGTNWSSPMVLLSLTVITVRILEMSESNQVKQTASKILRRYREIGDLWCTKLEELMYTNDSKDLQSHLLKATLSIVFTFNVSSAESFLLVVSDTSDITYLLKALFRLHHLTVRENIVNKNPPSPFICNLLRHARHAIPLNLQNYLPDALAQAPLNLGLHQFAASKWVEGTQVAESDIPNFSNSGNRGTVTKRHAYQAKYSTSSGSHLVCVDTLRGTFFLNGYPPSLLPENIIRHPLFQSYFRCSRFRVQRVGAIFKTSEPFHGHHFEFAERDADDTLIIRQLSRDNHWYELMPRQLLVETVPHDLVANYTHWFDYRTKAVYFRRAAASDSKEKIEDDTDYLLVPMTTGKCRALPDEWHLHKYDGTEETSCQIVSINSDGFQQIVNNLKKLERKDYIHVQLKDGNISARLWRHNLSFSLREDGLIDCDNYPGFHIPLSRSEGQTLGTLVGLHSGIILEKETSAEVKGKKKIFLVQHGTLSIISEEDGGNHQQVMVENRLRNPTYFMFEVDQTLNRISPEKSKSAWFYLAALHAATSSSLPDPFIQMTGTEMAIWILQSAYVWSCSPYDEECTETLQQISSLSPMFQYYPKHLKVMQVVTWPPGLESNSYAAYEGYAIIVEKLVRDSGRLGGLFPENYGGASDLELNNMKLCRRSYLRNINFYNKAAQLTPQFIDDTTNADEDDSGVVELQSCKSKHPKDFPTFAKYRQLRMPSPIRESVDPFIMTSTPLPHDPKDKLTKECLPTWLRMPFRENWLQLYGLALKRAYDDDVEHELTFILGAMLYSGEGTFSQLINLHNISVCSGIGMLFPPTPQSLTEENYEPLHRDFRDDDVESALRLDARNPPARVSFASDREYQTALDMHSSCLHQQVMDARYIIHSFWPAIYITEEQYRIAVNGRHLLNCNYNFRTLPEINRHFRVWNNNRKLGIFIGHVDGLLRTSEVGAPSLQEKRPSFGSLHFETVPDKEDKWKKNQSYFGNPVDLKGAEYKIMSTGQLDLPKGTTTSPVIFAQRDTCVKLIESYNSILRKMAIGGSHINVGLKKAGLHDRLAPVILLRDKFGGSSKSLTQGSCHVRGLAVVWAYLRRLNRLIMYANAKGKSVVELGRELETRKCGTYWNPLENPEWLLLELELDLTIRPVQVQVARQMMKMPDGKNGTMQLNMGEGKTSVIIPMIVASMAPRKDLVCRVTVLNSIFATNFNLLAATVGGLINRRLYTVPCFRDCNISEYLEEIHESYEECLRVGGAIMTLPEHRLSFRLQMYSNFLQSARETTAEKVHEIETWLRKHARDLVDESDEIFSVKYQLIYTTGKQMQIDGGNWRWSVCQKLLEYLPHVATQLFDKYGSGVVEFDKEDASMNPEKFTHFRILSDRAKRDLNELMVDGVLEGKVNLVGLLLRADERALAKEFLMSESISEANHNEFLQLLQDVSEEKKQVLLLVSGYLRRGILFAALKKRWRVEYGVKKATRDSVGKLMAVPFRAKDVAAERTEFGHPDVAILLTQLSYFYSGLDDNQLLECFHILKNTITAPEAVYNAWIRSVPPEKIKSNSVRTYKGINLEDYVQRKEHLFPVLRQHRDVINFWLENVVFPKECKQFPGKLVTNAWDLCYERDTQTTTGFSGTNDTTLLLPAQITQQELPMLVKTNMEMEETLKRTENKWERSLEMGVTCKTVLGFMIKDDLRVLIDAGAVMLQLGNEEIAQLWLDLDKNLAGVVYFSEAGEMVIKIRRFSRYRKGEFVDKDSPLALSPFKDNLDNCAVYLDDQHTRGTDIKLPNNFKACVTVGSGMRRDKLIQACMRMRKLGRGQSVHFYLTHEVQNKMAEAGDRQITVIDIINWTKCNSDMFEKDGLVYWATNARNYAKNLAADDLYELSDKTMEDGIRLGERCEYPDAQAIQGMYGTFHRQTLVTSVVPVWFSSIQNDLIDDSSIFENLTPAVAEMLEDIQEVVQQKCEDHIPKAFIFHNMLDEEQQRELEPEQERELQKYRPRQENPITPELHPNVLNCVTKLDTVSVVEGISRLHVMFRDTSIKFKLQGDGWGDNCFATDDFINVVKKSSNSKRGDDLDCFLKNIRFIVSFKKGPCTQTLLVSQYEVNRLITDLREGRCCPETTLHMFSGRWMEGQPTFVNNSQLQLPIQRALPLSQEVLAPLLIAAGNLYFDEMKEQRAFARFLGLRLRPWSEEEEAAFAEKHFTSSGFVLPSCPQLRQGCNFLRDPTELVRGILKIRNDVLRGTDHVVAILNTCSSQR